ncbi:hypothetical protein GAPWK_2683 [Gilliamella apicola]|jgi:conjugative transfer region protein, TIGR03750 family|uniref:TIGR03750 family conjugal transfer protein n=1 Tax=Gilliamella apicola TaxID=1196095 RepID=UPI00042F2DE6|nr:TIGR03750 family conjugal transfer protein [Gilliamella apicola]AHN27256.1 hypothetical protein GAPWK_2683 [Gilliamella apicola]PXV96578.1 conjugative transfer region protein (TIGR03750 family) [Gilliamella apicola]
MSNEESSNQNANGEIDFLPERLNRIPTVFRGMTIIELGKFSLIGVVIGFVLGLLGFIVLGSWVLIFIGMLVTPLPVVLYTSNKFSKLKRGKPDTWLERHLEFEFAKRGFGDSKRLLFKDEVFMTVRTKHKKMNKMNRVISNE